MIGASIATALTSGGSLVALVVLSLLLLLGAVVAHRTKPPFEVASPDELLAAAGAPRLPFMVETLVRGLYGRPPADDNQIAAWRSITRAAWGIAAFSFLLLLVGRRGLKSFTLALICVYEAVTGKHDEHAAPGTRIYYVIVAPELRQAREVTRAVRAHLDALAPLGVTYSVADPSGVPEITITNPTTRCERVITILTASATSVRGFAVAFVGLDEAGFLPSESHLAETGRDIFKALRAATAQFKGTAKVIVASTPGAPQGLFHDLVTKPPRDAVLVRAPTWVMNPAIERETCERIAGDPATFAQEFEVSRFGAAGETFLDADAVAKCRESTGTYGPRAGVLGCLSADAASTGGDEAVICFVSYRFEVTGNGSPIKFAKVEHIEFHPTSKAKPLLAEAFAARIATIARAFGVKRVRSDNYQGAELTAALDAKGIAHEIVSMTPMSQTSRWLSVREFVSGGRLAVPDDDNGAKLLSQLIALRATQLSGGALRVEGKKDDGADALALALEGALSGPPTITDGGSITYDFAPAHWHRESHTMFGGHRRWWRVHPNGNRTPIAPPRGTEDFERYAREQIASGAISPEVAEWLEEEIKAGRDPRGGNGNGNQ